MSFFIVVLFVAVLPLAGALICVVFPILAGEFRRAPGRLVGVACPAPASEVSAAVPAIAPQPRRTLRASRPQAVRIARPAVRAQRAA